jgi:hypothetical protein
MAQFMRELSAPETAPKTIRKTRQVTKAARQEKESLSQSDTDELCQSVSEAEERILRAPNEAAWVVHRKLREAGDDEETASTFSVEVFTIVALAAEAAAAEAAGYESWAAFETALARGKICLE